MVFAAAKQFVRVVENMHGLRDILRRGDFRDAFLDQPLWILARHVLHRQRQHAQHEEAEERAKRKNVGGIHPRIAPTKVSSRP